MKCENSRMSPEITRELSQAAAVEGMPGWETRLFLITYPAGADGSGHSPFLPGLRSGFFSSSPTQTGRDNFTNQ